MKRRRPLVWGSLCLWVLLLLAAPAPAAEVEPLPSLAAFKKRVEHSRNHLLRVVEAAEAAARKTRENPSLLINVPYGLQSSFSEELVNRDGALSNAHPPEERGRHVTPQDVLLMSARSWDEDADKVRLMLHNFKQGSGVTVLFASRAGMPPDIQVDHLIDNGATTGGPGEAEINALTNLLNGWLWCCEYAAALTRDGRYPGVLANPNTEAGDAHNAKLLEPRLGRRWVGPAESRIEPGKLGRDYLALVDQIVAGCESDQTRQQIDKAADVVANQFKADGKVGVATISHFLMDEITERPRLRVQPFHVAWQASYQFRANVKQGDVCIWIGRIGLSTNRINVTRRTQDYAEPIRRSGATFVTSYVTDPAKPDNTLPEAAAHIEQHWKVVPDVAGAGEGSVKVPFPPGVMAPVSGIDQGLIYRMLEDAVLQRLAKP